MPTNRRTGQYCTNFNKDFTGVLYDFSNSANGYMTKYPTGCGFLDLAGLASKANSESAFKKACTKTGTASATSCGSTGFYAKAANLVSKYNGVLASNCNVTG